MTDTAVIEEVVPGSADDPFTAKASGTEAAPSPSPAGGTGVAAPVATETSTDGVPATDATATTAEVDDSDEDLSPEEEAAISVLVEQIRTEVRAEELPKVQSAYDRRIQALQRSADAAAKTAAAKEQQLLAQVREAQLNGLSDAEKSRLQSEWSLEDEKAKVDAYRQEVEQYHKEVYIAECVAEFGTLLGIGADDLADFSSPEEIEAFVKDTALAYYRDLSAGRVEAPATTASATAAKPATATAPAPTTPAGLDAATDGGGGSAVPQVAKFDPRPGKEAMAANIASGGWETMRVG